KSGAPPFEALTARAGAATRRAAQASRAGQAIGHGRAHCLPGRRPQVQIAQAALAHALQYDAGSISREMEFAARLPDGVAELRGGPLAACQANGARPAAPPPQGSRLKHHSVAAP